LKIIHTADFHFREKDYFEIKKCVDFIVDYAFKNPPDLFVISGDITDSRFLDLDTRSSRAIFTIVNQMLDLAPVAIVCGTYSHEGKSPLALRSCRGRFPILVSDLPEQYGYVSGQDDVDVFRGEWMTLEEIQRDDFVPSFIISQIPQPTKQYFVNQLSILDTDKAISTAMDSIFTSFGSVVDEFDSIPHIVNGHGQIGGAFISETQQLIGVDIEVSKAQLMSLNADLVCYGHIHKAQAMGDGIFYAGSPTRMNHGETEDKGFYEHTIYGITDSYGKYISINPDLRSNFIKTPAIYLHNAKLDNTKDGCHAPGVDIMDTIKMICDVVSIDHDEWGIKITITAWQDEAKNINQAEIERVVLDLGAERVKVSIIRKPRETVRSEKVLEADTLPDKLIAMAEMRGETVQESILEKARMVEAG